MRLLLDYDWPGNVRELENAIEHAFVLCENNHIDIFDLPVEIRRMEFSVRSKRVVSANPAPRKDRKKLTRRRLIEILEASDWNKAEVGRQLGLSRASIWKYMRKWDIPMQKP